MAVVTICSDFAAPQNKVCHCFHCFPSYLPWWWDQMPWSVFWMLSFKQTFSLFSFTFIKMLFSSSLLSAIRVVSSEVTDISPSNLDSSLCFIQPGISQDVLCIEVKLTGWQYTGLTYSFSYLEPICSMSSSNQSVVPCPILTVASWPAYRFLFHYRLL